MTTIAPHSPSIFLILFVSLLFASSATWMPLHAQTPYKIGGKPLITLHGTSTLHDWTMTARTFTGTAQIVLSPDNQLTAIGALHLILPVKNLKGDKDGLNENAYESLQADKHKDIVFKLTSAKVTPGGAAPGGGIKYQIATAGQLTIAGVTRVVTMNVASILNADGSLSCSGSIPIALSQFDIERPSFVFGTMKVGDAMTLDYALVLVK